MNRFILLIIVLVLNFSCTNSKIELPQSCELTAKFIVLDEKLSPDYRNCSDTSVPYLKLQKNDCSFSIGNYEFDILRKYLIDEEGYLKEYWTYKSEGPLTYSVDELNQDRQFKKSENLDNFNVRIAKNRTEIIDAKDTLQIEEIFKSEKLILIKRSENNGQRVLYEFN